MKGNFWCMVTIMCMVGFAGCKTRKASTANDVFSKQNLLAWCVVPFDAKQRGPEERAKMLASLGIKKLAYDWREEHIPTFDDEWRALNKYGIELTGFWMMSGPNPRYDRNIQEIFDFLARNKISTQIWLLMGEWGDFNNLNQSEKIAQMSAPIAYIADKAKELDCKVALYNHGGWFGEPENQIEIIQHLQRSNVGIVYNFHHARSHHERFAAFYPKMKPYLFALNIAGLKKGDRDNFYRTGQGDVEKDLIQLVRDSDYRGPIGIINHDTEEDAETGLLEEMRGLKHILYKLGAKEAASSYE